MGKLFPAFLKKRDACPDIPQRGDRQGFLSRHGGIWLRRAHFVRFVAEFTPQSGAAQLLLLHPSRCSPPTLLMLRSGASIRSGRDRVTFSPRDMLAPSLKQPISNHSIWLLPEISHRLISIRSALLTLGPIGPLGLRYSASRPRTTTPVTEHKRVSHVSMESFGNLII